MLALTLRSSLQLVGQLPNDHRSPMAEHCTIGRGFEREGILEKRVQGLARKEGTLTLRCATPRKTDFAAAVVAVLTLT